MKPEVSILICAKGADRYIGNCLRSLLKQTFKDFEIVIVEDPPFDRTIEIVGSLRADTVRYIRNPKSLGLSKSRNQSIKVSKGRYIFFTDADCVAATDWIEQGQRSLSEKDCAGVEGKTVYVSEVYQPAFSDHSYVDNRTGGQFMTCNMAYKRNVIERLGGFDERYGGSEDRDLALRAMKIGSIAFNNKMVVYHQKRTNRPNIHDLRLMLTQNHPRVLLYKNFGDKPIVARARYYSLWRVIKPLDLATIFFPPLILVNMLFRKFRTRDDYNLLPYAYLYAFFERLQLWKTCARERVLLI